MQIPQPPKTGNSELDFWLVQLIKELRHFSKAEADQVEFTEISDPDAPSDGKGILYCKDAGLGKTKLSIRFATGVVQDIATEP